APGLGRAEDDVQELAARRAVLERGAGLARPHDDGVAHAAEPDAAPAGGAATAADRLGAELSPIAGAAGRADHVDRARLGPGDLEAVLGHGEARRVALAALRPLLEAVLPRRDPDRRPARGLVQARDRDPR